MKLSTDSKIVLWLCSCALAGAFLQSILDPIEVIRQRNTPRKSVVRVVKARRKRQAVDYAFN